jgi:hypothetical protein
VTLDRAEEYRHLAQECMAAARSASTEEARSALFEAARSWFRLAEEQDNASANIDFVPLISGEERPVAQQQQQQQVQPATGTPPIANDDDPNAPYTLYDGDELIGTYPTRAEARREQQKLESEAGSEQRRFTVEDRLDRIVL